MCKECKGINNCRCPCDGTHVRADFYGDTFCAVCGCNVDPELDDDPLNRPLIGLQL